MTDYRVIFVMTAEGYQSLIDAAVAMREIAAGTMPTVAEADVDAYLAAAGILAQAPQPDPD